MRKVLEARSLCWCWGALLWRKNVNVTSKSDGQWVIATLLGLSVECLSERLHCKLIRNVWKWKFFQAWKWIGEWMAFDFQQLCKLWLRLIKLLISFQTIMTSEKKASQIHQHRDVNYIRANPLPSSHDWDSLFNLGVGNKERKNARKLQKMLNNINKKRINKSWTFKAMQTHNSA